MTLLADANKLECRAVPPLVDDELGAQFFKCIGPKCMAWRFHPLLVDAPFLAAVASVEEKTKCSHAQAAKEVQANRAKYKLKTEPYSGYCGLAGKPEVPS